MTSSTRTLVVLSLLGVCCRASSVEPFVEGYAGRLSVEAGEQISLHLSGNTDTVALTITRIGPMNQQVLERSGIEVTTHPVPHRASSDGCGWPAALTPCRGAGHTPAHGDPR